MCFDEQQELPLPSEFELFNSEKKLVMQVSQQKLAIVVPIPVVNITTDNKINAIFIPKLFISAQI